MRGWLPLLLLFICAYSTWDWIFGSSAVGLFWSVCNAVGVFFWARIYVQVRASIRDET